MQKVLPIFLFQMRPRPVFLIVSETIVWKQISTPIRQINYDTKNLQGSDQVSISEDNSYEKKLFILANSLQDLAPPRLRMLKTCLSPDIF